MTYSPLERGARGIEFYYTDKVCVMKEIPPAPPFSKGDYSLQNRKGLYAEAIF
jgi:hypothetical protein